MQFVYLENTIQIFFIGITLAFNISDKIEGYCVRLEGTGDLNLYDCLDFEIGCPDKIYTDEEIYKCKQPKFHRKYN